MFALNIPSTFGDTIDCRINGKPRRVTCRDEHTLVIEADPYAERSSRHRQVRCQLVRLRNARQAAARRLHGKRNKRGRRIQKLLKSQLRLKNRPNRSSDGLTVRSSHAAARPVHRTSRMCSSTAASRKRRFAVTSCHIAWSPRVRAPTIHQPSPCRDASGGQSAGMVRCEEGPVPRGYS